MGDAVPAEKKRAASARPLRMAPKNEIAAALELLRTLPLDVIITSGIMFMQREIYRVIIEGSGDDVFTIKDNHPVMQCHGPEAAASADGAGGRHQVERLA